ncbi:unnamed protein product [Owenia fusiformis]|uniref:Uncharacterized protein n=1 Tax=Owenia fusiformis TaxID=6347 RepID=A0A8J1UAN7_OWEFU|nr:unnamed protein product [Owenia fusiformis]
MSASMLSSSNVTSKYDIPLDHLDYTYIRGCSDLKELEKILKALRSKEEGHYPDLEQLCEEKIGEINPNSRVLRKSKPISTKADLTYEEQAALDNELKDWHQETKDLEMHIKTMKVADGGQEPELPPIRGTGQSIPIDKKTAAKNESQKKKSVKPRSYNEWDKFDIEGECEKVDKDAKEKVKKMGDSKTGLGDISSTISDKDMTPEERQLKANREKDKGNEAFRCGDFEESITYYSRSLSLISTAASFNNRALAYLKLKHWDEAIKDCNTVLSLEPDNIKAFLRRGVAREGKKDYVNAKTDIQKVLALEPINKRAKDILASLNRKLAEKKEKGTRMVIEEVDEMEESDEEQKKEDSPVVTKKGKKIQIVETDSDSESEEEQSTQATTNTSEPPMVNGHANTEQSSTPVDLINKPENTMEIDSKSQGEGTIKKREQTDGGAMTKMSCLRGEDTDKINDPKKGTEKVIDAVVVEETPTDELKRPVFEMPPLPSSVGRLKESGNELFKTGQYAHAVEKYNLAIEKLLPAKDKQKVNISTLYSNRAACKTKIGDCRGCVDDCSKALDLVPHSLKPLLRRAAAYETMEKYQLAYIDYKHVLQVDNSVDNAMQGSSRCSQMLNALDGTKWREKLPTIPPIQKHEIPVITTMSGSGLAKSTTITTNVTTTQAAVSESQKASSTVTNLLTGNGEDIDAKFDNLKAQGNDCVQKSNFSRAIECYTGCISLAPERPVSYTNRALCYLRINKPQQAEQDCKVVLKYEPQNIKALFRRAQARKMLMQYKESLEDLMTLLKLDPKNSAAKKEADVVKQYYKKQLTEMKSPGSSASLTRGKKITIEEVGSSSDDERKEAKKSPGKITQKITELKSTITKGIDGKRAGSPEKTPGKDKKQKEQVKKASTLVETSAGLPKAAPSTPHLSSKPTPYEFMTAWNSLKGSTEIAPYAKILSQLKPKNIPKVLSNKLDGGMFSIIVKCVEDYNKEGKVVETLDILKFLSKVQRFDVIAMFMSSQEKQVLTDILSSLKTKPPTNYTKLEIENIAKQYGIK